MSAEDLVRLLLEDQKPSITHVTVVTACPSGNQGETIMDARGTIRGRIEGRVAYNERDARLGQYHDGKTYLQAGTLFGYGNLLAALVVKDARRRGVWH